MMAADRALDPQTPLLVCIAALQEIDDASSLAKVAAETTNPEVGVVAVVRLVTVRASRRPLTDVAERARHDFVRVFAHALLAQDDGK